jgi:hypothetical protein
MESINPQQDYVEYQATKGRHYTDREETLFYLKGLSTNESQGFRTALRTILDKMDYRLGQVAQTVAELAQSDKEVGQDALTILSDPTVRMIHGQEDPVIRYICDGKPDDRRYDTRDSHPGGRGNNLEDLAGLRWRYNAAAANCTATKKPIVIT